MLRATPSQVAVAVTAQLWKPVLWPWGWRNREEGSQEVEGEHCPAGPSPSTPFQVRCSHEVSAHQPQRETA